MNSGKEIDRRHLHPELAQDHLVGAGIPADVADLPARLVTERGDQLHPVPALHGQFLELGLRLLYRRREGPQGDAFFKQDFSGMPVHAGAELGPGW